MKSKNKITIVTLMYRNGIWKESLKDFELISKEDYYNHCGTYPLPGRLSIRKDNKIKSIKNSTSILSDRIIFLVKNDEDINIRKKDAINEYNDYIDNKIVEMKNQIKLLETRKDLV